MGLLIEARSPQISKGPDHRGKYGCQSFVTATSLKDDDALAGFVRFFQLLAVLVPSLKQIVDFVRILTNEH
jgi:hypothetical protein